MFNDSNYITIFLVVINIKKCIIIDKILSQLSWTAEFDFTELKNNAFYF